MDEKNNVPYQPVATPVVEPQTSGTVQSASAANVSSLSASSSSYGTETIPSPYESLDTPESTTVSTTISNSTAPTTQPQAFQPKPSQNFRDKDTNKLLMRLIAGTAVVALLLFGAAMISNRFSSNRVVDPISQFEEQTIPSLSGSNQSIEVRTNQSTLLVNGTLLATDSLRVTDGAFEGSIVLAGNTQDQSYVLPNASGTFCLDSNNCGYLTGADVVTTSLAGASGALTLGNGLTLAGTTLSSTITQTIQTSVNNSVGSISLQGTNNQVTVTQNGNTLTLSGPQDLGITNSPTFASIALSGVGTQNGNVLCDISNNCGYAGGTSSFVQNGNSFGAAAVLGTNDNFSLAFETNGTTRLTLDTSGNAILAGGQLRVADGSVAVPSYSFTNDVDTGVYLATTDAIGVSTGGVNSATFTSFGVDVAGRLAVGDASSLSVAVGLYVNETFTAADSACTNGCYGAQIVATADDPTSNNGLSALSLAANTAATAFVQPNVTGLFVGNPTVGAGSSINIGYGIRIASQTAAASNYGIAIGGAGTQALWLGSESNYTTAGQGIGFGINRDTNLYRSATDTLRTDDTFVSGTRIGINTSTFGTNNRLTVNANTTTDNLAAAQINTGLTTNKGLVIQGTAGQTANLQEWQSSTGSALTTVTSGGDLRFYSDATNYAGIQAQSAGSLLINTVTGGSIAINPDITLSLGVTNTGQILLGRAGLDIPIGLRGTTTLSVLSASSRPLTVRGAVGQTANLTEWQNSSSTVLGSIGATGSVLFQNSANSTTALRVLNAAGTTTVLDVDTSNSRVGIGTAAPTVALDVVGDAIVSDRLQVGPTGNTIGMCNTLFFGSLACDAALDIANTSTETNVTTYGILNTVGLTPGGVNVANNNASQDLLFLSGANNYTGQNSAVSGAVTVTSTAGTISQITGIDGSVGLLTSNATTATISDATALQGTIGLFSTVSGGTITTANGLKINAASVSGVGASIGTNYGINVAAQTAGTTDYGIAVGAADTQTLWLSSNADNTTANAGIALGLSRDTNLYRSAVATLRTDGQLSVGDDITVTGDVLPSADDTYDLGSNSNRWRDLYLGPATLSIGTSSADYKISYDTGDNSLLFNNDQDDRDFRIAGTTQANLLYVDAGNNRVGIGTNTLDYELDVVGTINASSGISVNGTQVCSSTGCTAAAGSGSYIQNGTSIQANSNLAIQSAAASSIGVVIRGAASQTASLQEWQDSTGSVLTQVTSTGVVTLNNTAVDNRLTFTSSGTSAGSILWGSGSTTGYKIGKDTSGYFRIANSGAVSTRNLSFDGANGLFGINTQFPTVAALEVAVPAATNTGIIVRGASGQTATLQEWQNSTGTTLLRVNQNGVIQHLSGNANAYLSSTTLQLAAGGAVQAQNNNDLNLAATGTGNVLLNTGGSTRLRVTDSGVVMVGSSGTAGTVEKFRVNTPTTVDNAAAAVLATGATTTKGLVVQGAASQTANLQEWQTSTGSVLASIGSSGLAQFSGNIEKLSSTAGVALRVSDGANGTGTITLLRNGTTQGTISADSSDSGLTLASSGLSRTIKLQANSATVLEIASGQARFASGSAGTPSIGFSADTTSGLYYATNQIGFSVGGTERLRVNSSNALNITGSNGLLQIGGVAALERSTTTLRLGEGFTEVLNRSSAGRFTFGTAGDTNLYRAAAGSLRTDGVFRSGGSDDAVQMVVSGNASQTLNLQEWRNSTGTVLASISATGNLSVVDAAVTGNLVVTGSATFNGTLSVNGKIVTGNLSGTTTVAAGAGAGTGASASLAGNDTAGTVTVTTGSGAGAGNLATVTFSSAYGAAPRVILTPANGNGPTIQYYINGATTTTFVLATANAPADATEYIYNYQIMQ